MALPVPRGGHAGSRTDGDWKVHSKQAEHGRAYIATRPLLDLCKEARAREGARVSMRWWNRTGIDWDAAKTKRGGGGETYSTSGLGSSTDGEEDRKEEREDDSKASGSSGAEWSGASADEWE